MTISFILFEMSGGGWLAIVLLLTAILIGAIGLGWWFRNHSNQDEPNSFTQVYAWSKPQPGPDGSKNFCQLYQFPTAKVTIGTVPTVVPGSPTLDATVLNRIIGSAALPVCLDTDQIVARQIQRTCVAPNGVTDGSINRCYTIAGDLVGLGATEQYFSSTDCPKISACPGQLSLVSVNYQVPTNFDIRCMTNQGAQNRITMSTCDPSLPSQLFRVTRIDPGQNPNNLTPQQGQNGILAQILDRVTGLCVVPGPNPANAIYDPSYLSGYGCSGFSQTVTGQEVILSTCTGGTSPGYVWALIPSLAYCGVSGSSGCTAGNTTVTPPQLVYAGNLDFNTFPGSTGYKGLTGGSAVFRWLLDNNAQSLYYGAGDNSLILQPIAQNATLCTQKPQVGQYLNLALYNTLEKEAVCLAQTSSQSCFSL